MSTPTSSIADLHQEVSSLLPPSLGSDAATLLIASVISSSTSPHLLADLYTHLTSTTHTAPDSQTRLSLRLRDLLLKQVTLIGAPQVLSALIPLAKVDCKPEHADAASAATASTLSPQWASSSLDTNSIHARGVKVIDTIYGSELLPKIFASFGRHSADVQFMELFTVYGLYLSEFSVLSALETEFVVWATITCTGWTGPALWHMRGLGRLLGARGTEEGTEVLRRVKDQLRQCKVAAMVAVEWVGPEMVARTALEADGAGARGWPNVGDVVRELGGWGDDPFPAAEDNAGMNGV
jgi:hypothetical protein